MSIALTQSGELSSQPTAAAQQCARAVAWKLMARECETHITMRSMSGGCCTLALIAAWRRLSGLITFERRARVLRVKRALVTAGGVARARDPFAAREVMTRACEAEAIARSMLGGSYARVIVVARRSRSG